MAALGARVETAAGAIAGRSVVTPSGRAVLRFLGVPYACPPVGELRWRAPVAPTPWTGVRDATSFAPAAPQAGAVETVLPGFAPDGATSEDCLALNVWTPSIEGDRPVIVWLPGGAYLSGSPAQPVYDAARLADEGDAVVVTVAYRLGALGFLAPEGDADANCGLRDQLAALAWVREHAAAFGGDPRRITLMGESAGAGSVLHLLASPTRDAVFDRAIAQSGQPTTLESAAAAEVAHAFARSLGLDAPDAEAMRAFPVERILAAQQETLSAMYATVGLMPFAPSIDSEVVDGTVRDGIAAGRASDVDLVVGTTRDELSLFPDPRAGSLDDERLIRRIERLSPVLDGATVVARYRDELGSASNAEVWDAARTDAMMRVPNLRVADAHAAHRRGATYVYRFDWAAPGLGAAHAVDVPFTFGTFDREGWDAVVGHDARAEALGTVWRRAWTRFAATGEPAEGWAPYDERRPTQLFGATGAELALDPAAETRRCWMA